MKTLKPEQAGAGGLALGLVAGLAVGYALFRTPPPPAVAPVRTVAAARPDAPRPEHHQVKPDAPTVDENGEQVFDPDQAAQNLEDQQADDQDEDVTVTGVREDEDD